MYTIAAGAVRTWSATGSVADGQLGPQDAASISWAADGRHLLFGWLDSLNVNERLLDTSLGGSSLMADSRLVRAFPGRAGQLVFCQGDIVITPDGAAIICPGLPVRGSSDDGHQTVFFREYSTATGKVIRQLATWTYANTDWFLLDAFWSNPSGSVIIGVIPKASQTSPATGPTPDLTVTPSPPAGSNPRIGVISGQTFTPLDLPGVTNGVW